MVLLCGLVIIQDCLRRLEQHDIKEGQDWVLARRSAVFSCVEYN